MLTSIVRTAALAGLIVTGTFGAVRADGDHHHRPPQQAFDACQSKSAGDSCQVTLHERTLDGTCAATPEGGALACRPNHPPGPPPQMTEACSGKSDGDACTFTHGDRSESGVCRKGRSGTLVCLP